MDREDNQNPTKELTLEYKNSYGEEACGLYAVEKLSSKGAVKQPVKLEGILVGDDAEHIPALLCRLFYAKI